MKNRNFLKNSILLLLPISMGIGVLFGASNKHDTEVSAYTKDGALASTIDLRDNTPQEIRQYYSSLSDLSATDLQGNNLLKNLKPILKNGQKYFAYDSSGDDIWKMYEIIDRDWEKSPASAITGYSASTNKITGYKYGTSTSNKGTNPYIHALYVDRSVENETRAWDDHQQTQWGINREHIWPKSQGFDANGAGGARGDPMHLWAGNGRVNGTEHNNNMYGFVDKSKSYTNPYDAKGFKNLKDNYSGKSLTVPSSTDTVFEPQDCDKGDIARSIFYMVARYNNLAGNDTIDTNNPNLALKQTTTALASYTTTSSNKQTGYMGLMTDLLYWNHLDPVDEFEIHRNNLLFNNYTFNRNPFIDFPEWADYIWGKPVYNGRNFVSYSSTPTGSVNLSTDVINGFNGEQPQQVTVTSIEVTTKPTKLVYNVGETLDTNGMVVKAHMSNNTTKVLSSSEYTVAPSGALKTSDTQATVTYEGKSTSFAIAVKGSGGGSETTTQTLSFDFSTNPGGWPTVNSTTLTNYSYTLDQVDYSFALKNAKSNSGYLMLTQPAVLGLPALANSKLTKVVAHTKTGASNSVNVGVSSSNSSENYITGGAKVTWSEPGSDYTYNLSNTSDNTVYYLYVTNKNAQITGLELTYQSSVSPTPQIDVESISLNKNSTTLEIGQSDSLTATIAPEGASIKLVSWSSSDSAIAEVNDEGEITARSAGTATITCSALDGSGVTATCTVTVNSPVVLTSISLSGQYATEFYLGDTFSTEGMTVMANYSDGSEVDITDDIEISGYDTNTIGIQTVTISYGDTSTTYTIEVKEKGLDDNQLMFTPSQYGLVNGDDLTSYTESIATLTFNKNSGSQPKFYTSSMSFRIYAKNSFTIVGTKNIIKVEFEMSSGDTVGDNVITANVGNLSNNVWTGESNSITFSVGGTSGQRNIVSIKVTYDESSQEIATLSSISLSGNYKIEFFKNEEFTCDGLIVTAHYSDETTNVVTPSSVSTPTMSSTGTKTITVSYTEGGITKNATYDISVIAVVASSIELTGNFKTEFNVGEEFSYSGMTVVEHFNDGSTSNHYASSCTFSGYDMNTPGEQTVTVDYHGLKASYTIHVVGSVAKTYVATINPTDFTTGGYAVNNGEHTIVAVNQNNPDDTRDITVATNQVYQNSSAMQWQKDAGYIYNVDEIGNITSVVLNSASGTFYTSFDDTKIDSHQVSSSTATSGKYFNVSAGGATGKTASVVITFTVIEGGEPEKELSAISLGGNYKTDFNVGDDFSFGGTVTATYSDESTEDVTNEAAFTGYDLSTVGNQTITVTYGDKTATYSITVTQSIVPPTPVTGLSFSKITTLDDIEEGARYIIGFEDNNTLLAMPNAFEKKMGPIELQITSGEVVDTNNECFITLTNVSGTTSKSASITNGEKYLNTASSGTDFTIATNGTNWTISCVNGEFLFENGDRSLLYRGGATNKFGNYATSNIGSEYHKVCLYKEVEIQGPTTYKLVTDASTLGNGDEIIIVGNRNGSYSAMSGYSEANKRMNITTVEINNGVVTSNDDCLAFTLEKSNGKYGLKCENGYYSAPGNTSAQNKFVSQQDTLSTFSISIAENGAATICANISTGSRYIRYNSASAFMSCYTTTTIVNDVYIYKKTSQFDADVWSKDFLSKTAGCEISDWDSLAQSYIALSTDAKREISNALPVYDEDSNLRQQAAARYDYIVGDPRYDVSAFITERAVSPVNRNVLSLINIKDNPTIYIVLFAIAGLTTIGAYIYIKRRKEGEC